jgi:CysZ protein
VIGDFSRGFRFGVRGAALVLSRPRLWPPVIVPFVLSLAALAGVAVAVFALREHILPAGGVWRRIVEVLTFIAVPVVCYFLFLPVASLIAAPFNDTIAERVEEIETGRPPRPGASSGVVRSLLNEGRRFLRWATLALGILAVSILIPGVGSLVGLIGGGYLAARFAAWDAIDYTLGRWGYSYDEKLAWLRRHRPLCLGAGAFVALILAVPILNALAMPLAAAGGALLCVDVEGRK